MSAKVRVTRIILFHISYGIRRAIAAARCPFRLVLRYRSARCRCRITLRVRLKCENVRAHLHLLAW
jgi:hypothetical protein